MGKVRDSLTILVILVLVGTGAGALQHQALETHEPQTTSVLDHAIITLDDLTPGQIAAFEKLCAEYAAACKGTLTIASDSLTHSR